VTPNSSFEPTRQILRSHDSSEFNIRRFHPHVCRSLELNIRHSSWRMQPGVSNPHFLLSPPGSDVSTPDSRAPRHKPALPEQRTNAKLRMVVNKNS